MLGALFPLAFCGSKVGATFCCLTMIQLDAVNRLHEIVHDVETTEVN
jgi:hypothetical protein